MKCRVRYRHQIWALFLLARILHLSTAVSKNTLAIHTYSMCGAIDLFWHAHLLYLYCMGPGPGPSGQKWLSHSPRPFWIDRSGQPLSSPLLDRPVRAATLLAPSG